MTPLRHPFLILIQYASDAQLLLPVADELRLRGVSPLLYVTRAALKSESLRREWKQSSFRWRALHRPAWPQVILSLKGRYSGFLSAAESSAPPHRLAHRWAQWMNRKRVPTFTMQHGLENIGLNYADHEYPAGSIDFASQKIFLWGKESLLHPDVSPSVRSRCVAVGCTKKIGQNRARNTSRRILLIFENLHWSRYSQSYRDAFVRDLEAQAIRHPNWEFHVKSHPTGRWLFGQKLNLSKVSNLTFLKAEDAVEFGVATAVITTPSTIALDAAMHDLPVAVLSYGLELGAYKPLSLIQQGSDWEKFLDSVICQPDAELSRALVERNCLLTEAANRVADKITEEVSRYN